jgi:BirA family transcriptional regulator, biotin operon repressor / biotin---[acetyl-CoA-carboxylase] ligase
MQDKILSILKKAQGYVSGEEISERLKITRQGLWKHIQQLKDDGYDIAAVPHIGYQLVSSPDRLFPPEISSGLQARTMARKIYYFDAGSSTMEVAVSLGLQKAPEGTLVLAESQQTGRGRMGREWASTKYKGLYLSLILRPEIAPAQAPVLTLLTAVAACEACLETAGVAASIKWPNDILVQGKKLGGILTELEAETDAVRFVVIGLGLNVNARAADLPGQAVSLREVTGAPCSRIMLLQEFLRRMEAWYLRFQKEGPAPVIEAWKSHAVTLGRRVKVHAPHAALEGEAVDLDADGALLVRDDAGLVRRVTAGDVVHCR